MFCLKTPNQIQRQILFQIHLSWSLYDQNLVTGQLFGAFGVCPLPAHRKKLPILTICFFDAEGSPTAKKSDKFGIEIGIEVGMNWGSVKKSGGHVPPEVLTLLQYIPISLPISFPDLSDCLDAVFS